MRLFALAVAAVALATPACTGARLADPGAPGTPPRHPSPVWHESRALGTPTHGRLLDGVQLPAAGAHFFTWDPGLHRSPSRPWRRWGTDRLVRIALHVVEEFAREHPRAAVWGIGDLSRPHGGPFGASFGGLGHFSHQNGLDVDVYYPRRDGREQEPERPSQIDRPLAQDLLERFLDAGAELVYIGPHTHLVGPPDVVHVAGHHDNHMHVRIPAHPRTRRRTLLLGRSVLRRPIVATEIGNPEAERKFLIVGCIHGRECAGAAIVRRLRAVPALTHLDLWLVPDINPDGHTAGTRQNARGVDLNRNFPAGWRPGGRPWDPEFPGPRPLSEPEARIARAFVLRVQPTVTLWFHQPQAVVRAWGGSVATAWLYARLAGVPFRAIPWPAGTAPRWQNTALGEVSFVVELPPGRLAPAQAQRYADAVVALGASS